jgi:hypothetical protein
MAIPKLISAGVFTKENDLSFVPRGVAAIGAALVGLTQKGPAFLPQKIDGFESFRSIYGNLDPQYYLPYAAYSYLNSGGTTLTVTRILNNKSANVGAPIFLAFPAAGVTAVGNSASNTAMAVLRFRSDSTALSANINGTAASFTLSAAGTSVSGLSLDPSAAGYIGKVMGTDPTRAKTGEVHPSLYVDAIFGYAYTAGGVSTGSVTAVSDTFKTFSAGYTTAQTPVIVSQNYSGTVFPLFYFVSKSDGDASNYEVKVSIQVEAAQLSVTSFPYFNVYVRGIKDSDSNPIILESFRCNLDPSSNAFIGKVIGDRYATIDNSTDPPNIKYEGDYNNVSNYIRVVTYTNGMGFDYPTDARPSGFNGATKIDPTVVISPLPYITNHLNEFGAANASIFMGVNFVTDNAGIVNIADRIKGSVVSISGAKTADKGFLAFAVSSEYVNNSTTAVLTGYVLAPSWGATPASTSGYSSSSTVQQVSFTVPLYGGSDGFDPRSKKIELMNNSLSTEYIYALSTLSNTDEFDFNLIALPGVNAGNAANGNVPQRVISMIQDRGDAFYIMDIADASINTTTGALDSTVNGVVSTVASFNSSYAATYFPWLRIADPDRAGTLLWVPPSVDVIGSYANNDRVGQQFYAPAGYTRGTLGLTQETRTRLNITQRDTLYANRINPIPTFSDVGPVVWGQKTLQVKASALDRVNVRRLLIFAKKYVASVAKYYAFEQNTPQLRQNILDNINPFFTTIQQQQGLTNFKVILDESVNTPDVIDRNQLVGKIFLQPTKTAEILIFEFNILNSGTTFFNQ